MTTSVKFATKRGATFTGIVKKTDDNTYLTINGSDFYGTREGLTSFHAEEFLKSMGDANAKDMQRVELNLDKENKQKVFLAMHPDQVIVKVLSKETKPFFNDFSEKLIEYTVAEMADGSTKTIERTVKDFISD